MADLYSIATGLQPTQEQVREAETFARQFLESQFPTMDLRSGTGVADMVIRPTASLIAMLDLALSQYFANNTLSAATDNTPTATVDGILSNWFMTRKSGETAIINARLYFGVQKTVTIPSNTYFSPDNTLMYYPSQDYVIQSTQLTFDNASQEYYIDIPLYSAGQSTDYNLESGSLLYFSTFDAYFLRAEINYLTQEASPAETNTQFIARAQDAISTRNLINTPSIISNLTSAFPTVIDIVPVGMGDPEMQRDLVQVNNPSGSGTIDFHIGGRTDVYCKTPLTTSLNQYTTDSNGDVTLTGPIYNVAYSTVSGGPSADTITNGSSFNVSYPGYSAPGTITNPQQDVGFSALQYTTVSFGSGNAAKTVSLKTNSFQLIDSIQTYLDSSSNRVITAEYLARGNNIYILDFTVTSYTQVVPNQTTVTQTIKAYLDSLVSGQSFVMSDLLTLLSNAGISHIKTPIPTTYTYYGRDFTTSTGTITDYLDPQDRTANFRFGSVSVGAQTI